jgi:hypothetical protein
MVSALANGLTGGKWFSLADKVIRPSTLEAAWRQVARNKGAAGVDGQSVERFAAAAERYLSELHQTLKTGRYRPSPVKRVDIPKSGGGNPSAGDTDGQEPAPSESRGPHCANGAQDGDRTDPPGPACGRPEDML